MSKRAVNEKVLEKDFKKMNRKIVLLEAVYILRLLGVILIYPLQICCSLLWGLYQLFLRNRVNPRQITKGEVALITGSGRGLGRCIAIALAEKACSIAVADIQGTLAEETADYIARKYGVKTKAYKIDVTNYQQLLDLRSKISQDLGDVTILVNNAGILFLSSVENPTPEEVQRMLNVNLAATIYTTQIFLPKMKELNRGNIVNISSMSALIPVHFLNVYSATKAAVRNFTSSLRIELLQSNYNIRATCVIPTSLDTSERCNQLLKLDLINLLTPVAEGEVAAMYVVNAILNGADELTVPRPLMSIYKLQELLPSFVAEVLNVILGKICLPRMDRAEVQQVLKTSDIKYD